MNATIKYQTTDTGLKIEIKPVLKPIVKAGLFLQGTIFLYLSIQFLIFLFLWTDNLGLYIFLAVLSLILCYFLFRVSKGYFDKLFLVEIILVNENYLSITNKTTFSAKELKFNISNISNLKFVGESNTTTHPLEGNTVDALGFGAGQREINYLIQDGAIEFFSNGITKRFGKNLASWQVEEVIQTITDAARNDLTIDDGLEKLKKDLGLA